MVAEALHRHSPRAAGPFVAVNASSLSDELFESEMFGHVRGSFTGAVGDREGFVAAAQGGTLFLDEVTDLSPRAQAKLLRFLERREYRRVGENRLRQADVRILSAANVALEERLRADLVFRLKDVVLALPPLRERGDDVLALALAFLRREVRPGRPVPALAADARRALQGYAWPGNVRELQREMRRAVVLAGRDAIRAEHLSITGAVAETTPARRPLKDAVLGFERQYVAAALRELGGNRARTAVVLGITRQALVAKIARLGLG
jgi:DNA-binding NtrC family response regulator